MYNLFYYQLLSDGTEIRQHLAYESKEQAKSRFHTELAQVGVSPKLKKVSAMVFADNGRILAQQTEEAGSEEIESVS